MVAQPDDRLVKKTYKEYFASIRVNGRRVSDSYEGTARGRFFSSCYFGRARVQGVKGFK